MDSYEQDQMILMGEERSKDESEKSRFDVLREIMMEELGFGNHKIIKNLVSKLAKKANYGEEGVGEYVWEWFDEVARFLRTRGQQTTAAEESVESTAREASEMEMATKLERFKVKTLNVLADAPSQANK